LALRLKEVGSGNGGSNDRRKSSEKMRAVKSGATLGRAVGGRGCKDEVACKKDEYEMVGWHWLSKNLKRERGVRMGKKDRGGVFWGWGRCAPLGKK